MKLNAIAISAPAWISRPQDGTALNSSDPASLFNACRYAGLLAQESVGAWGQSNWHPDAGPIRRNFLLLNSLDDMSEFVKLLLRERPNLLLIGSMTLCMPGAIACAAVARALLGDRLVIVLGGRHPTETIYVPNRHPWQDSEVQQHPGSPLGLMASGRIPRVFDLVVSGDGEHIIAAIGEAIAVNSASGRFKIDALIHDLNITIPGKWIIGWLDGEAMRVRASASIPIDYTDMPSIARVFGVSAAFDVFPGCMTAHVFCDIGRGCVYDCTFCSERNSVTDGLRDPHGAARRLYRHMREASEAIKREHPNKKASAFIEDSVLLGGIPNQIDQFISLLQHQPIDIIFGAQLTIDHILSQRVQLERLSTVGLRYLFIGIETLEPEDIGGMSKDLRKGQRNWQERLREALNILDSVNIKCGAAVLFGLGEPHKNRVRLLEILSKLQEETGHPDPISANWAVQHPLRGQDGGANYDYVDWGCPEGPFLHYFQQFGEASVLYPLHYVEPPKIEEVREVSKILRNNFVASQSFPKAS